MFRIESYVTPIIMEYVAKYVKNIRSEDMQLSLWEGEVTLQNLDLRLDVLEEELQLPCEFLSGHVHELTIRVPWTKITSEPIRIIINTIEFVLKLRHNKTDDVSSASSSPQRKTSEIAKKRKRALDEHNSAQQTAGSGIVNKIINNINLECHNIILKFVEDDIVLSMNVQLLQFGAADERWKIAMTDVHPVKVMMRKLIKVSDLTICMDKRNSAGHIEVCQEPILYRCSFEIRILRKYNTNTVSTTSLTRVGIFTKSMDINITSMQFPMVMRLIDIMAEFGRTNAKFLTTEQEDVIEDQESEEAGRESILLWAWNKLPTLSFEPVGFEEPSPEEVSGHLRDIGVYLEELNVTLKNSELIVDTFVGNTKRIKYTPIVRLTIGGLYFEKVSCEEQNWRSTKSGISYLIVDPLGSYRFDDISDTALISSPSLEKMTGFMDNSLFDEKAATIDLSACINYDGYMSHYTDEYLLHRTPIIAFDSVEYKTVKIRDNRQQELDTSAPAIKDTNLTYRILSSGLTFRWNQSLRQVKQTILDLIDSYDYSGYHVDQLDTAAPSSTCTSKLPPPLMEDYDELMAHIPLCIYKFDLKNINFEIYAITEPTATQKHAQHRLPSALKQSMPYFLAHIESIDGTLCRPLYPDKLVHTTCQLPEKPHVLLDACHDNYTFHMKQISFSMVNRMRHTTARLVHIPQIELVYSDLLQKQHWKEDILIPMRKVDLYCEHMNIDFSKRDLIIAERLLNCVLSYRPYLLWKIANQSMQLVKNELQPTLHNELKELRSDFQCFQSYSTGYFELYALLSYVITYTDPCVRKHILMDSVRGNEPKKWLTASIQSNPEGIHSAKNVKEELIALAIWVEPISIFVDMVLLEFLKYQEDYDYSVEKEPSSEVELHTQQLQSQTPTQTQLGTGQPPRNHTNITSASGTVAGPPLIRRSSRNSLPSRKISHPEETIHFSSERDEKVDLDTTTSISPPASTKPTTTSLWQKIKCLVISLQFGQIVLHVSEKIKWYNNQKDIVGEYTQIQLPRIALRSTNAENLSRTNLQEKFTIHTAPKDTINWVIALYGLSVKRCNCPELDTVLSDVYTTITIVVTHKTQLEADITSTMTTLVSTMNEKSCENICDAIGAAAQIEGMPSPAPLQETTKLKCMQPQSNAMEFDAITIHVDTTPIHFHLSETKCKALHLHLGILDKVVKLIGPMAQLSASAQMQASPPPMKIITASEESAAIKQFLELETSSSVSSVFLEKKTPTSYSTSLFCQWSIAKIICELTAQERKSKIVFELEDLLSTVDKREDYTKFTGKVGQCNLNYYTPDANEGGGWLAETGLRLKMLGEVANMPFLNIVYTSVGLKSFYTRIGVKPKCDANRSIAEIIVTVQAMEIILDLKCLREFVGSLGILFVASECEVNPKEDTNKQAQTNPPTVSDLPLIHLDSKGFTIYTPLATEREYCTVIIWKIESIKMSPNLENPLQRNPLRIDVYSKAAQLGFLNTPGSLIEDRQYELVLQNLSVATGHWTEILGHMAQQAKTFQHTNPAVEWNTQNREASPHIANIFKHFTFIGIFAPCIAYNNVLICGQALEFNCASDFVATLNTDQLYALGCMACQMNELYAIIAKRQNSNGSSSRLEKLKSHSHHYESESVSKNSSSSLQCAELLVAPVNKTARNSAPVFEPIDEHTEQNVKTDSGIQSQQSRQERLSTLTAPTDTVMRKFPQTISFIAGTFTLQIYDVIDKMEETAESKTSGTEKTDVMRLVPLLSLSVSQPSFMFTQNIYDSIAQISVFNLNIHSVPTIDAKLESANPFSIEFVDTRPGELGPTGVPPPLITLRKHLTKQRLVETDIEVARPIIITLLEDQTVVLFHNTLILYQTILRSGCLNPRTTTVVQKASKIMLMRSHFYDSDRLHTKLDKVVLLMKHEGEYECKLVCADMHFNATFLQRPEKSVLKASVGAMHLQLSDKIFVHPIALRSTFTFVSEPWYYLPLVSGTVKVDVLQVDMDVSGLKELQRTQRGLERMSARANEQWKDFLRRRPPMGEPAEMSADKLMPMKTPRSQGSNGSKEKLRREEFYQDDLRAGAFQFVEMATDTFLPLPYQIQIIKKNFGIICWRYPQPRKMCKIHVFPVPMAVQKPINIRCQMEYFSESHECFLHFSEFWLSETSSKDIVLPEREICANIWRVVIMQSLVAVNGECFEPGEEEEDKIPSLKIEELFKLESNEEEFILHPKVLVGCMRIDTAFQSDCVPKLQVLLSCTSLQVKFFNQADGEYKLPPVLAEYTLAPSKKISQEFLVVLLENLRIHAVFNASHMYSVDSSLTLNVKCLDYGFLNMLSVLEDATLQSYVSVNKLKRTLNINAVLEKFRINIGPSILHTLLSSKAHWQELFQAFEPKECHVLLPKCIVANCMHALVSFGQTGTTERIQLQPLECSLYSFGNDGSSQELSFYIADNETRITDASQSVAIPFKFDGERKLQTIRIGDKCLIIESQKLSATQVVVQLKGQIELISMVPQELRAELRFDEKKSDIEKKSHDYLVKKEGCASFYAAVQRTSNVSIRLKMVSPKVKGRTGDIPLKPNKKLPWLVKVPTSNNEFVSLWVRIVREDIEELCNESFEPQRILVTIWPIFEVQSRLPCTLAGNEHTTGKQFEIEPRGGRYVLDVPATHLTEHKVKFHTKYPLNCECDTEQTLSLKSVQWNTFFWYDEKSWGIDDALYKLKADRLPTSKWPLDDEDELRVQRISHCTDAANLLFVIKPAREFSCSTCLEVTPWAMFINATGIDIGICIGQIVDRASIKSNCIEMLSAITTSFTIDLPIQNGDAKWVSSAPIYCNGITPSGGGSRGHILPDNDSIDIGIVHEAEIYKFVLEHVIKNEQRVFRLRPKYVVANFTNRKLQVLAFAMDHKESARRQALEEFNVNAKKFELVERQWAENYIGSTLDSFHDLKPNKKAKRTKDTAYVYFASIKLPESADLSIPIALSIPFTRRCFALQNGEESLPLVVTLIEKDRIYYLNIFEDNSPALLVTNQTDVQFIIAQTSASENSKVSNTTPEYSGRHFEWYQHVPAYSKCYYTPPELYTSFPDVESTTCNITLALYKENPTKKLLKWSKPIRTDRTWEKFLYIPNHGDVKVIVCDKHRVTRIFVYYIAQLEFSVKDLRSRLLTPQTTPDAESPNSSLLSISPSTAIHDPITMRNTPAKCRHFSNECNTKTQLKVRCFIKELIVSLHADGKTTDCVKSEIVGLYADDTLIAFDDDDDDRELHLLLPNLQLDNQNYVCGQYDFPVVLCAQELYERKPIVPPVHYLDRTYQNLRSRPLMAHFQVGFFEDEMKLHSIVCSFSPMRIYIEDSYLNYLLDAVVDCTPSNCAYRAEPSSARITLASGEFLLPRVIVGQAICIAEPLQIRQFQIDPLSVLLSVHTSIRLYIALDHSPLSFSTYNRQYILTVPLRFGQSLSMHYLSGAIFGAGWVVGSLEILGSPSGLARSFTTGLRDFVSMPVEGLFRGPWGFIIGITQGSASLLRNVTAGTLNSVSKLAASVARNLDRLTLDQEHIERTEALRRCRPHGFTEGLAQGVTGLGISILGAVGGLARHTLEARSPVEVMTGVGKGLVGAVAKPLSGAAELLALTGQGVLHTVGFNTMPELRVSCLYASITSEPSAYRIWKLLPGTLKSDQILFNHEVTLVAQEQLRRGYALLTTSVFALMELQSYSLMCVFPIDKVEMTSDLTDTTLYYIHLVKDKEGADEENYTNQRIITYIHSSTSLKNVSTAAADSLNDLLQNHEQELQASRRKQTDWSFYINEALGEHIIKYLRVMKRNC